MKTIEEIKERIKILTEQEAEAIKQGDLECAVRCNVAVRNLQWVIDEL